MNFGAKAGAAAAALKNTQKPTYLLAPNFTTRPFPDGPLDLGTVVEDLESFYPINQGTSPSDLSRVVRIPEGQRYTDVKEDVRASARSSSSREASFLASVLDGSMGGDASLRGQRSEEDVYTIARLETVYFYPSPAYVKQVLQLGEVKDYLDMADYKAPVYLITGLKIAWGATVSSEQGRERAGAAGAEVTVPGGGVIDAQVGAHAAVSTTSGTTSSFGKPADFVLGIRVLKVHHKRAFIIAGERTLATERVVKNAVLVGDDGPPMSEEERGADETYTVADVGEGEDGKEFVPVQTGEEDEIWLVPANRARGF